MKKLFIITITAVSLSACSNSSEKDTVLEDADSTSSTIGSSSTGVLPADNSIDNTTGLKNQPANYTPAQGDILYQNDQVMVWKDKSYVSISRSVMLDSGITVKANGDVTRNGVVIRMKEGERINKAGEFFDKTGNAIKDAWVSAKKGVENAGDAINKTAKKAGDHLKDSMK